MIDLSKITAFDVETKGREPLFALQPFRARTQAAWLTSCAVAYWNPGAALSDVSLLDPLTNITTEVLRLPNVEQLDAWLDAVIDAGHYVVCWNAPFDVAWLIALGLGKKVFKVRWLDAMLFYRHLTNAPKFRPEGRVSMGLKSAVAEWLPDHAGYDDGIDFEDESSQAVANLLVYNQLDARFTLWLLAAFIQQMRPETVRNALIEAQSIPLVAQSIVEGLPMDREIAASKSIILDDIRKAAFMRLKMAYPTQVSEEILSSPTKLRRLLFDQKEGWGLPPVHLTDTGEFSTDKETLQTLGITDERALTAYEYRSSKNLDTKFARGVVESLDYNGDGNTRPQMRVFGTYTGRGTYSSKTGKGAAQVPTGVAIHQWPKPKMDIDFRDLLVAPEGCDIIECDFAGQEFGWMAVVSGDPVMLSLRRPGQDAHCFMGARAVQGWQYEALMLAVAAADKAAKSIRQFGKVGNLSLQYRTSWKTLITVAAIQHGVFLTPEMAESLWKTYRTTYRAVPAYWKRQIAMARQLGYVTTLAGRVVHLGHPDTWVLQNGSDATWAHESTAINFPIQGVGADQKYLALAIAKNYLPQVGGRFLMDLHDGLFFAAPKDKSMKAAHDLKYLLSNLPYKKAWGVNLPIDFPVDAKIGPTWQELKEIH